MQRDDAGAPLRIKQALEFLSTAPAAERLPTMAPGSAGGSGAGEGELEGGGKGEDASTSDESVATQARRMLSGEWLLGFTVKEGSITFAPPAAMQQLRDSEGLYERLTPSPVGIVRTTGALRAADCHGLRLMASPHDRCAD